MIERIRLTYMAQTLPVIARTPYACILEYHDTSANMLILNVSDSELIESQDCSIS